MKQGTRLMLESGQKKKDRKKLRRLNEKNWRKSIKLKRRQPESKLY